MSSVPLACKCRQQQVTGDALLIALAHSHIHTHSATNYFRCASGHTTPSAPSSLPFNATNTCTCRSTRSNPPPESDLRLSLPYCCPNTIPRPCHLGQAINAASSRYITTSATDRKSVLFGERSQANQRHHIASSDITRRRYMPHLDRRHNIDRLHDIQKT
jgi:hypothetical protein